MRLPAGLEATGEMVSLDEVLDYGTSARGGILTRTDAGEGGRVAH